VERKSGTSPEKKIASNRGYQYTNLWDKASISRPLESRVKDEVPKAGKKGKRGEEVDQFTRRILNIANQGQGRTAGARRRKGGYVVSGGGIANAGKGERQYLLLGKTRSKEPCGDLPSPIIKTRNL